ncbi:MAG: Crp/Fnr family transcriptional regulator [Burkholderiaceae bacterium]|nr:MAG: Crp/Fnr family transcriptional regulator [Burkholderiaceae bacterium]
MKKGTEALDWPNLTAIQPVAGLIPEALRLVTKRQDAGTRERIFRIGDSVRNVYLVISGEARLIRLDRRGKEVILQRSRGGFIAEASLDSRNYHCDAIAAEPTTLLLCPAAAFRQALERVPAFSKAWQSQLAGVVRKLRAQCERLSLHSAADRITHYIEAEGTDGVVTLRQTRMAWAAELGLTHEALYRTLRLMREEGFLEIDGNRICAKA